MSTSPFTWEYIDHLLHYDPESGKCFWKVSAGRMKHDTEAGYILKALLNRQARRVIMIDKKNYGLAYVIWFIKHRYWPKPHEITFKDKNPLNTRIENLVLCLKGEGTPSSLYSNKNIKKRMQSNNTSGHRGVYWCKNRQVWYVVIQFQKKQHTFGVYHDYNQACRVQEIEAEKLHHEMDHL